jgi:hypothetical protein
MFCTYMPLIRSTTYSANAVSVNAWGGCYTYHPGKFEVSISCVMHVSSVSAAWVMQVLISNSFEEMQHMH